MNITQGFYINGIFTPHAEGSFFAIDNPYESTIYVPISDRNQVMDVIYQNVCTKNHPNPPIEFLMKKVQRMNPLYFQYQLKTQLEISKNNFADDDEVLAMIDSDYHNCCHIVEVLIKNRNFDNAIRLYNLLDTAVRESLYIIFHKAYATL